MNDKDLKLVVKLFGQVQGVGMRLAVFKLAQSYQLTGWVENQADQGVLILTQGPEAKLKAFLAEIKSGDNLPGEITKVESESGEIEQAFKQFKIKR